MLSASLLLALLQPILTSAAYSPVREYSGKTFFDRWDYYGDVDNTTWGNVTYLDRPTAASTKLTEVNAAGNAIIRVDNVATIEAAELVHRNSIKITSQDTYGLGSVIVVDMLHLPYGCSVWPSLWLLGTGQTWPAAGEIDIIEGINMYDKNQFSLHTTEGCTQAPNTAQVGKTITKDCLSQSGTNHNGCITEETKPNSLGKGFSDAKGGVYAIQIDASGVYMWFWGRAELPPSISAAKSDSTIDLADWGSPSAAYPASTCNITQFFQPQKIIFDITLCGDWAGVPALYSNTCPGECIASNIIGPGSPTYDNAFFEISYIRAYGPEGKGSGPASDNDTSGTKSADTGGPSGSSSATSLAQGLSGYLSAVVTLLFSFGLF
ncbi:concanavalin A-like lectin/glucanase domain-containing protein [Mycena rebaudengoi]|nr:concanavalin A-like lectin/glucanase domain-containing protein [Mycena rebaudengoi]